MANKIDLPLGQSRFQGLQFLITIVENGAGDRLIQRDRRLNSLLLRQAFDIRKRCRFKALRSNHVGSNRATTCEGNNR